jgi:hypothetical protein
MAIRNKKNHKAAPAKAARPSGGEKLTGGAKTAGGTKKSAAENTLESMMKQKEFDEDCIAWCEKINLSAGKLNFNAVQFLSTADEEYGTPWQKLVCKRAKVDPDRAEEFWNRKQNGGINAARAALSRRRSNATTAMKNVFMGKSYREGTMCWCSRRVLDGSSEGNG